MMRRRPFMLVLVASMVVVGRLDARAQPTAGWPTRAWPSSSPEAQGMDPSALQSLDRDLAGGRHGYIDGMLVVRHGHVIFEDPTNRSARASSWAGARRASTITTIPRGIRSTRAVFTAWNIYDESGLGARVALGRVLAAVKN